MRRSKGHLFLLLPGLSVAGFVLTLVLAAIPRSVFAVRIRGGPTEGSPTLSWRVELVEVGNGEHPAAGRHFSLRWALANGETGTIGQTLDDEGAANVAINPGTGPIAGPVHVKVYAGGAKGQVADASVSLTNATWTRAAHRRGGWTDGQRSGALEIRAAPKQGTFVAHFSDGLVLEVRKAGSLLAGVDVHAYSDDADVSPRDLTTNAAGRALLRVRPRGSTVSIRVRGRSSAGEEGSLLANFPAETSPFHVFVDETPMCWEWDLWALGNVARGCDPCRLIIEGPPALRHAYVAFVDRQARLAGATVDLFDGRGLMWLPALPSDEAVWALVSSSPTLGAPDLIGWPLPHHFDSDPPTTFDVPDMLLLDNVSETAALARSRVHRVLLLAALLPVVTTAIVLMTVSRRANSARKRLEEALSKP